MLNTKNIRKDQLKFFLPNNWIQLSRLLNFREKLFVSGIFLIIFSLSFFWIGYFYKGLTILVPKKGGEYSEGIVGQPLYINPLLSQSSEIDADLTLLIFSGLFKYDKKGEIVPDLAESYEISEDKKTYTVKVRENVFWHDGEKLKIEDIIFTFKIIRDPAYKSPLRYNWQGVDINQKDQNTIEFNLKNPYFGFLNNLTVGILPKHIWENIAPEKFQLADVNLRPIGSGPYRFFDFQKNSQGNILSYQLEAFSDYFGEKPYISILNFNFYQNDDDMISSYNRKQIKGMSNISSDKVEDLKNKKSVQIYEFSVPRYFAVFF